jgi:hypothetical protein
MSLAKDWQKGILKQNTFLTELWILGSEGR